MTSATAPTPLHVASRVVASLLGSYVFVWGFAALGVVVAVAGGMSYADAYALLFLLAFLVYLVCFCWAIAAKSLLRVWLVLAGGGAVMTVAAWLWSRALT